MLDDPIVIVSYARTPIGNLLGSLKNFTAPQLGSEVIQALVSRAELDTQLIDEVIIGCVLTAGLGQAPARQAALGANLPRHTGCTTLNKVCGSAMKAVMLAHDTIKAGSAQIIIAGGMESMTHAPYLLLKAREGYRAGHHLSYDHMMLDGLEDAYEAQKPMGSFAEECVQHYGFTRQQLDEYAMRSFKCAQVATEKKLFHPEIVPLRSISKEGEHIIEQDEHPYSVNPEKIPKLSPAFKKEGCVTAGNSSSIADGAAALALMKLSLAKQLGIKPIARVCGMSTFAKNPAEFTTAPIDATQRLLAKLKWQKEQVDLFEVNEAFAVVALAFIHEMKIPLEKLNVHGGACALGHPIGASGARIICTLLGALQHRGLQRGIATLCIGGGEATALAVEMM